MDRDLLKLEQKNVRLAYVFSDSDPGYLIAKADSPKVFRAQEKAGISPVAFIDDADHTMSKSKNRLALIAQLERLFGVAGQSASD